MLAVTNDKLGRSLTELKDALEQSWVVTLKTSGQHLSKDETASKYSVSLLADRAGVFGALNFTFNATYSRSSQSGGAMDPTVPPLDGIPVKSIHNLDVAAGLTGTILQHVIQEGRGAELTASFKGTFPIEEEFQMMANGGTPPAMMMEREEEWRFNVTLDLPYGDSAKIPLSPIYTNDPNALVDNKFVEGRLGVSWDFDAVTKVLKGMAGSG